ncbi:dnaJ homolog subfamily B member 6-B isoform X2 [Halyomorpha halys]|uniref:dnaJ homolog subfamily B member 6-B isoform X2 n=1 Tax=Halyomorpha halys TaxID=286706 RepID=UPI0034D234A0
MSKLLAILLILILFEDSCRPGLPFRALADTMVDYYKILEVNKGSSNADIKKAYRRLALKWHPDKNPDNADEANKRFKEISEAYEVLSDDAKRKIYDEQRSGGGSGKTGFYHCNINGHHFTRPRASSFRSFFHHNPFRSFFEKKRRVYDQYGREGLNERRGRTRHYQDEDMDYFGFPFTFRDPEEVFREFFGGSPFADLFTAAQPMYDDGGRRGHRTGGHQDTLSSIFSPMGGFGFGFDDMLSNMDGNAVSFTSFSSSFGNSATPVTKRTSTSTRFINGKKITTKKVIENGKETVMQYENDILKSKTVNGVAQAISYN